MKIKPIAITFSDIHFNHWKAFNSDGKRINHTIRALGEISDACITYGSKEKPLPLLFPGDLFHNPFQVSNTLFNEVCSALESRIFSRGIEMYAISGNHDQCERNTFKRSSPTWLGGFSELKKPFHLVDFSYADHGYYRIFGIPYLKDNNGFVEVLDHMKQWLNCKVFNILMIHTDIPGASDCSNRIIGEVAGLPINLKKAFKPFNLVLNGHIHLPKTYMKGKLINVGSPIHQIKSDAGVKMGYWIIYSDFSAKFVHLKDYPQFVYLEKGQEKPDKKNYYIPYRELVKVEASPGKLLKSKNRLELATKYCKIAKATKTQTDCLVEILNQTYEITNF